VQAAAVHEGADDLGARLLLVNALRLDLYGAKARGDRAGALGRNCDFLGFCRLGFSLCSLQFRLPYGKALHNNAMQCK
jgi:hypothetical protein